MNLEQIRSSIQSAQDTKIVPVPTPEWPDVDGHVYVRTMSQRMKEAFIESISRTRFQMNEGKGAAVDITLFKDESTIKLAACTTCDEHGQLLFTLEDVTWLGEKHADCVQRIIDATSELNGFSDKSKADAKNVSASVSVKDHPTVSTTELLAT